MAQSIVPRVNAESANLLPRSATRVLCLGNDLLADDAFGLEVAERLRQILSAEVEIVCSAESGFGLVECVTGCDALIIVDCIRSGATPGTIHTIGLESLESGVADSPHRTGIMEVLKAARTLGLSVPQRVVIHAVEAADVATIGGPMDARVRDAIAIVVNQVTRMPGVSTAPATQLPCAGRSAAQAITQLER